MIALLFTDSHYDDILMQILASFSKQEMGNSRLEMPINGLICTNFRKDNIFLQNINLNLFEIMKNYCSIRRSNV